MTTTYESTDPSSTPDAAYTRIQQPQNDYESADAAVPMNGDYLIPTQTGDLSTAPTVTATYESVGRTAPTDDGTYTALQIPQHDYEVVP